MVSTMESMAPTSWKWTASDVAAPWTDASARARTVKTDRARCATWGGMWAGSAASNSLRISGRDRSGPVAVAVSL